MKKILNDRKEYEVFDKDGKKYNITWIIGKDEQDPESNYFIVEAVNGLRSEYDVIWNIDEGEWECSCLGFKHCKHCKHINLMMPEYPPATLVKSDSDSGGEDNIVLNNLNKVLDLTHLDIDIDGTETDRLNDALNELSAVLGCDIVKLGNIKITYGDYNA